MRRTLLLTVALALVASAGLALAQGPTDFSGTWTMDREKSDPPPTMGSGAGPGPGGGMGGGMGNVTLVVTQTATHLTIERKTDAGSTKTVYALDGSESTNPGMRGGKVKSRSTWDGGALVTESTQTMTTPMGEMTIQSKEVRTVSPDGSSIIVWTTTTTPRGTNTRKTVFTRQAS